MSLMIILEINHILILSLTIKNTTIEYLNNSTTRPIFLKNRPNQLWSDLRNLY